MMKRLTVLAAAVLVGSFASSALGLSFVVHENNSMSLRAILARGDIEKGDTDRLRHFLAKLPKRKRTAVYLDSNGGNLYEGLALGKYFYESKIKTAIEGNVGACASACALAFLGGRDEVTGKPWRAKSSTSRLGFHSFAASFDFKKSYSAKDMESLLQSAQFVVLDIADYLRAIGTDLEFLRIMFRAASDDMNWISNQEALQIGIHVWDERNREMVDSQKN